MVGGRQHAVCLQHPGQLQHHAHRLTACSVPATFEYAHSGTAQPAAKAATPKLAIMVHAVHNQLAGGGSSTNSNTDNTNTTSTNGTSSSLSLATSSDCFYVRAGLHSTHHPLVPLQQRKTALVRPTPPPSSSVVWSDGLLQLEPHGAVEELEVLLQLKRRNRLTRGSGVIVCWV